MPSDKKNLKLLALGAAATVVVGGAYLLLRPGSKQQVADDEDAFDAPAVPAKKETPTASPSSGEKTDNTMRDYSFKSNEDPDKLLEEAMNEAAPKTSVSPPQSKDGSVNFESLGVSFTPHPGWVAKEELSPMPNVAMVSISKPEFADRQQEGMGAVPVVILSIEDISSENLNLSEFVEKSKQMAFNQMMAMTGGMCQPEILYNDPLSVGPFGHCLEYAQRLPPYFDIKVFNLLHVQGGLAYVFQLMGNPDVISRYKADFMEMGRSMHLSTSESAFGKSWYVEVRTGEIEMKVDPSWTLAAESEGLAAFNTSSTVKAEKVVVYRADGVPSIAEAAKNSTMDGVQVQTFAKGSKTSKRFSAGDFVLEVTPKMANKSFLEERLVVAILKTIEASSAPSSNTFFNLSHGYHFPIQKDSKLIASKIGGGTVIYAPMGVPQNPESASPENQGPTVTIRVGTPETDPDCLPTLGAWKARMESEGDGTMSEIKITQQNGEEMLSFVNKDMQETGPGERVEMTGKVQIFVRDGKTTLIRWETATGQWRKFEKKLQAMMDSFEFI